MRELGDLIWQKMTTDDIISWSQSALFPPGATLFTSTLDECWMTTIVSEARELMTSNDKSRSRREISLKWDWATRVKQVFRPISCYRCCEDMMKALRLTNDENEKRAKAAQNTCKHSVLYCMALCGCVWYLFMLDSRKIEMRFPSWEIGWSLCTSSH